VATEQRSRCPAHEDFDPLSEKFLTDPFAVLATLPLGEAPVFYAPTLDYYVVTRYADIEKVFLDNETYSAATAQVPLVSLVPEAVQILLAGGHERSRRWPASTSLPTGGFATRRCAHSRPGA